MKLFALATAAALGATTFATPAQAQARANEVWVSAYVAFSIGYCMSEQGHWTERRGAEAAMEYLRDYKRYPEREIARALDNPSSLENAMTRFIDSEGGCSALTAKFINNLEKANRRGTLSDTPFRF